MTQAAASGDQRAQREVINLVLDQVRRTVSYLAHSTIDAEDIVQQTLIEILHCVHSFRGDCSLRYWADRIAVRAVMKVSRKHRRRTLLSEIFSRVPATPPSEPDETLTGKQIRIRLAFHLQKLSETRKTVFVLHYVNGYKVSEIAEMIGVPPNTVRDQLQTSRQQLRKAILMDQSMTDWVKLRMK